MSVLGVGTPTGRPRENARGERSLGNAEKGGRAARLLALSSRNFARKRSLVQVEYRPPKVSIGRTDALSCARPSPGKGSLHRIVTSLPLSSVNLATEHDETCGLRSPE